MTSLTPTERWSIAVLYAWVSAGSIVGGLTRYLVGLALETGSSFPWATLFINATGSLIIGFYATLTSRRRPRAGAARTPAVCDDRLLRWIHHLLDLQPGDVPAVPWRYEIHGTGLYRRLRGLLAGLGVARPHDGGAL